MHINFINILINHLLVFTTYIALPTYFITQIWKQCGSLMKWSLWVFLCGSYLINIYLIGFWPIFYGFHMRTALISFYLIITTISFKKMIYLYEKNTSNKNMVLNFCTLIIGCVFMMNNFSAFKGILPPKNLMQLEFPLKGGEFCIVQGGDAISINHHYHVNAQKYAIDIVKLNALGLRASTWHPKNLDDFNIYSANVYSPCEGVIIECINHFPDQKLGSQLSVMENPAGNYLAIADKDINAVILLAHLKKGSFKVQAGDQVHKGQVLAQVGNSGNTTEPHLHIHAIKKNSGDLLFSGKGIPLSFENRFLVRSDRIIH